MSFCTVLSAAVQGLSVEMIRVEADVSNGLPMFHMVGYLSSEVKEASERVRTAIRNSGMKLPAKKIIVNLAPATVRKRGASFDLPIALAVLAAMNYVPEEALKGVAVIGEVRNILQDLANLGYVKRRKKGVYTIEQIQVSNMVSDISR